MENMFGLVNVDILSTHAYMHKNAYQIGNTKSITEFVRIHLPTLIYMHNIFMISFVTKCS